MSSAWKSSRSRAMKSHTHGTRIASCTATCSKRRTHSRSVCGTWVRMAYLCRTHHLCYAHARRAYSLGSLAAARTTDAAGAPRVDGHGSKTGGAAFPSKPPPPDWAESAVLSWTSHGHRIGASCHQRTSQQGMRPPCCSSYRTDSSWSASASHALLRESVRATRKNAHAPFPRTHHAKRCRAARRLRQHITATDPRTPCPTPRATRRRSQWNVSGPVRSRYV